MTGGQGARLVVFDRERWLTRGLLSDRSVCMLCPHVPDDDHIRLVGAIREKARRGDFRPYPAAIATLESEEGAARAAAAIALRYEYSLTQETTASRAWLAVVAELAGDSGTARAWACAAVERHALLAFDRSLLAEAIGLHQSVAPSEDPALLCARGWLAVFEDDVDKSQRYATDATRGAMALSDAQSLVEATTLKAWAALLQGELEAAIAIGRRASRMARTESLPHAEYLANITLSRIRRLTGMPHLAVHILIALLRVAPFVFRRWMRWELTLAHGEPGPIGGPDGADRLTKGLHSTDGTACDRAFGDAAQWVQGFASLRRELEDLHALVRPNRPARRLLPFRRGEVDDVPYGFLLHGTRSTEGSENCAWVLGYPNARGLRVLSPGVRWLDGVNLLAKTPRKRMRTDSALAALVLAGPKGTLETAFFERLYRFTYDPELHENALTTLYQRVKERLGSFGVLRRADGRVRVELNAALLVPDPRCGPPQEFALLAWLGRKGGQSARDAAMELGMSVRVAQKALRKLVDEGVCVAEREGRLVYYRVDDTTFSEVTSF